jgi:hypothetical protein
MLKPKQLRRCRAMETPLSPDDFNQKSLEIIRKARGPFRACRIEIPQPPFPVREFDRMVATEMADAMQEDCALC